MQPVGILHARVRCARCSAANTVDLRKAGLRQRARCGRCGEALPRKLPAALWMALGTVAVLILGAAWLVAGEVSERREARRLERVGALLEMKRPAEAVPLLRLPRRPTTPDALLAARVAEALADPVVRAAADPDAGPAAVEDAIARADELVDAHEKDLPELLELIDAPVGRLKARAAAHRIMVRAIALASSDDPDPRSVDAAIDQAWLEALDAPAEVSALARAMEDGIRARAALARARKLVGRRVADAQAVLREHAGYRAAVRLRERGTTTEPPAELLGRPLVEQASRVRDAVTARDRVALARLVQLRPDPTWDEAATRELDGEVRRACLALASLETDRARSATDPTERIEALLAATTCDEVLPGAFMREAQAALAGALLDDARRGADVESAVAAWAPLEGPARDRALAAAACLAESRDDYALSVRAWSLVASREVLATIGDCPQAAASVPFAAAPALEYPSIQRVEG